MEQEGWGFAEGDEIVPGRFAMKLLGGGSRFEAYLAWDEEMHALVVAKMVRPHLVEDAGTMRGLSREAAILDELDHPVLLRSFGATLEGSRPHLLLEHLEGGRLSTLLRKQRKLAIEQAIPLGTQLNSALIYMHNKGIVHLDVKPGNIIMGAPPRLIDLSIARTFEDAARANDQLGTDAYMAPEQVDSRLVGPMGPKADVWGWGVTMYEAVMGTLPFPRFDGGTDPDRFPQLHLDPAPLDRDVPPALAALILSSLEKRAENRPTQREVAEGLDPLVAVLPRKIVLSRLRPRIR